MPENGSSKTVLLSLRVTPDGMDLYQKAADGEGLTLQAWVRKHLAAAGWAALQQRLGID